MTARQPEISVIFPIYNGATFLGESIECILNQTFEDFELLLLDDGSTDDSMEIQERFAQTDPRIRLLPAQVNQGLVATLLRGLDHARGRFIARQDADDISPPERFARERQTLVDHPQVILVNGGTQRIDEQGRHLDAFHHAATPAYVFWRLLFSNYVGAHAGAMWRHDPRWRYAGDHSHAEDYLLWQMMSREGDILLLEDIVLHYRIHGGSISRTKAEEQHRSTMRFACEQQQWLTGTPVTAPFNEDLLRYINRSGPLEHTIAEVDGHLRRLFRNVEERYRTTDPEGLERIRAEMVDAILHQSRQGGHTRRPLALAMSVQRAAAWDRHLLLSRVGKKLQRRFTPSLQRRRELRHRFLDRVAPYLATVDDVLAHKTSETLFILGSGASIHELTPQQWELIQAHDTLGFNFWLYHDFVPTYYHIEPRLTPTSTGLAPTAWQHFQAMWRRRQDLHGSILMMSRGELAHHLDLPSIAAWIAEAGRMTSLFLYTAKNILREDPGVPLADVFRDCPKSLDATILRPTSNSLGLVIGLGVAMGYKRIVLLGIDLKHSEYFWKRWNVPHDHLATSPENTRSKPHLTLSSTYGVPADKVVAAMNEGCLKPAGVELFIGSKESALYPALPYYFEEG